MKKAVLILTEGTAKVDNHKYKDTLHRDPPKRVRHRTDQYDSRKDRAEILDHKFGHALDSVAYTCINNT